MNLPITRKLENGLRICLKPNLAIDSIAVQLIGFAGSNQETASNIGAAHFLEHWLIKDSNLSQITSRGGKFIGITGRDTVLIGTHVLKQDLESSLLFLSEIFYNPQLNEAHFESIKKVVQQEILRQCDKPEKILAQQAMAHIYPNTRLEKPNIGTVDDLEILAPQKVKQFYKAFYLNENFVLAICGNFDEKKTLDFCAKYFSAKTPLNTNKSIKVFKPVTKKTIKEITSDQFSQCYLRYDIEIKNEYQALVLAKIYSLYFKKEVEKHGLAYITSVNTFFGINYGFLSFFATTSSYNKTAIINLIEIIIQKIQITKEILETSKNSIIAQLLFSLEKPSLQATYYGEMMLNKDIIDEVSEINKVTSNAIDKLKNTIRKCKPKITIIDSKMKTN